MARAPASACFTFNFPGASCNLKLDGGCSTGTITSYSWTIDGGAAGGGVTNHSGSSPNRNWPSCNSEIVTVTLTVSGPGGSDTTQQGVTLPIKLRQPTGETSARRTALTSVLRLRPFDGGTRGSVVVNGTQVDTTNNSGPFRHEIDGRPGINDVEAFLASAPDSAGLWTFDFSRSEHFVPGSLHSERGQVLSLDDHKIVFRLSGAADERIKFTFRLTP